MADDLLAVLLGELPAFAAMPRGEQALWLRRVRRLTFAWPDDAMRLFRGLIGVESLDQGELDEAASALISQLAPPGGAQPAARVWNLELLVSTETLASRLGRSPKANSQLLRTLALSDDPAVLAVWVRQLLAMPAGSAKDIDASLVPLFQRRTYPVDAIFPALLDGLAQPVLAAAIIDLANYLHRGRRTSRHPAADRAAQLTALIGELAQRLQRLEEHPPAALGEHQLATTILQESVPLLIALCDAVALIESKDAIGKLNQVLELRHRRLRTEAACALARLGEKSGVKALVELTKEPVVRSRALAYLDEVGATDEAPVEMRTSVARGEGDLAAWLAAPAQFGLGPQRIELLESQTMQWPGYDEPIDCHLFSFEYVLPQGSFSGIGLAGPVSHAFGVDLQDYPPADIFAIYSGWHADHAELRETHHLDFTAPQRSTADRWRRRLLDTGYADARIVKVGHFFGEQHFVFEAERYEGDDRSRGVVVVDGEEPHWYRQPATSQPPGERELYWLHRGRKLLAHFNPKA